ncbi:MAG: hypothetical protein D6772_02385, partial [Bacteroidetes bacterium]
MQKLGLLVLTTLLLCQCQSDHSVREEARAAAAAMAKQPKPMSEQVTKSVVPPEQLAPGQTPPTVAAELALSMGKAQVKKGQTACLTVRAVGFTDLIGLQFSLRWKPEEITFERIDNMQLTALSKSNFGLTHTDQGVAAMSWLNPSLAGVSLPRQAPLFDVCFRASGPTGTEAKVSFASQPTA